MTLMGESAKWYRVKPSYPKPAGGFLAIGPRYPGELVDSGIAVRFRHHGAPEWVEENAPAPYPALFAILYGAGVEVSAALACVESDVDVARREVRARGTKAHTRDRIVRVAEWAWPFVERHLETLTPGERLFRGLDRWQVGDAHRARLVALGLRHHRLHDSRHFYAIRAIRAGTPYELVARQLGHADVAMVAKVYGRFAPRSDERDRWEKVAAERDREALEKTSAPWYRWWYLFVA